MYVFAPLVGALITVMSGVNSRFAGIVGNLVAMLVIHVVGLAAVSAVLLFRREEARPGRVPVYYYLGGFIGVGTVFATIYSFGALGASLAVALALLGQTLCSVVVDATGFLGRARYPLSPRSLPGIGLAVAGVAVMGVAVASHAGAAGNWQAGVVAMLIALASGVLPGLSFILNSELGRRKGMVRSTRVNYIAGLATTLLIVAAVRPPAAEASRAVVTAGPFLALGGGLMGVAVVTAMNFVFPRMPAFSATLLLFSGQALAGVLIDGVAEGAFDVRKLVGTFVLLAGLAVNALLTRRVQSERPAVP
jgi:transporter family-2 protein